MAVQVPDRPETPTDLKVYLTAPVFKPTNRLFAAIITVQVVLSLAADAVLYPMLANTSFGRGHPALLIVFAFAATAVLLVGPAFAIRHCISKERARLLEAMQDDWSARCSLTATLLETESRFHAITENISQLVWIQCVGTGRMLYVSPAYERMWGRSRDALYDNSRAWLELVHPDDLDHVLRVLDQRSHETAEMEYRICRDDGEIRWMHSRSFPVNPGNPKLHRVVGTVEDITDRKRAETASRESEERYRELFENAKDAVYVHDLEGVYISVNRAAEKLSGYSRDEVLGRPFNDFLAPENTEELRAQIRRKLREHGETSYEIEVIRKDGHRVPVEVSSRLIYENGVPIGVQGMARDITERRRAEHNLRESEELHRQLFESNPLPMWVVDKQSHRFLAVNPAAVQHYGYTHDEFLALTITDIWPDYARSDSAAQEFHGSTPLYSHLRKDGESIDVEVVTHRLRFAERDAELMLADDVTERRRMETERRARDQALETARIKSAFLANMSHEIRTPMNGILGMTELALQTDLTGQQRQYMSIVRDSTLSLLTIVNDILDFSKIEAGRLGLETIPFSLHETVADAARTLALQAHEKELELTWHIGHTVPDALLGDPVRLRQVLTNLIGNAIKFTVQGEVTVDIERDASATTDDVLLTFSVADTGVGIAVDKLPLIFQPFSQADSSTTREYGGTGLGLSISSQLVDLMGGQLLVQSEEGKGSVFSFTAPFAVQPGVFAPSHNAPALQPLRVLVIDDNVSSRRLLEELLTSWQVEPTLVSDGNAGLAALRDASCRSHRFDLVLLDACMPNVDGFEVVTRMQEIDELSTPTIMMLSSVNQNANVTRLRGLGVTQYLIKPIAPAELVSAIQLCLHPDIESGTRSRAFGPSLLSNEPPRTFLLVEDNATNQKLVVWTLEQQGHSVVVANNGREALDALSNGNRFDAVLMDVQMPVMNGIEATRLIRAQEMASGKHIPILAMTALAMKGDRERCLEAGMDGYLSKPVHPQELFQQLNLILNHPSVDLEFILPTTPEPPTQPATFDREVFLDSVGGNELLAQRLVTQFVTDSPDLVAKLATAVLERDSAGVMHHAHSLKGAASIFRAGLVVEFALALETMGRTRKLDGAAPVMATLNAEVERLYHAFIENGFDCELLTADAGLTHQRSRHPAELFRSLVTVDPEDRAR